MLFRCILISFLMLPTAWAKIVQDTNLSISGKDITNAFCGGHGLKLNLTIPILKEKTMSGIENIQSDYSFKSMEMECKTMARYLEKSTRIDLSIRIKSIKKVFREKHQYCNEKECFTRWVESDYENVEVWYKDFKFLAGGLIPNTDRLYKESYPIGHCPTSNPVCNIENHWP